MDEKKKQKRTLAQNRALHKYFELVANEMMKFGLDVSIFAKLPIDVPISKVLLKEAWRSIQKSQLGKESTKELTTAEITPVYETFNRWLAQIGLHVPFPSIEDMILKIEKYNQS